MQLRAHILNDCDQSLKHAKGNNNIDDGGDIPDQERDMSCG